MIRAQRESNEARMAQALIDDPEFAPTDPDREQIARQVAKVGVGALAKSS